MPKQQTPVTEPLTSVLASPLTSVRHDHEVHYALVVFFKVTELVNVIVHSDSVCLHVHVPRQ